jgi:hypothetical protein
MLKLHVLDEAMHVPEHRDHDLALAIIDIAVLAQTVDDDIGNVVDIHDTHLAILLRKLPWRTSSAARVDGEICRKDRATQCALGYRVIPETRCNPQLPQHR